MRIPVGTACKHQENARQALANPPGHIREACGSCGVVLLDGRATGVFLDHKDRLTLALDFDAALEGKGEGAGSTLGVGAHPTPEGFVDIVCDEPEGSGLRSVKEIACSLLMDADGRWVYRFQVPKLCKHKDRFPLKGEDRSMCRRCGVILLGGEPTGHFGDPDTGYIPVGSVLSAKPGCQPRLQDLVEPRNANVAPVPLAPKGCIDILQAGAPDLRNALCGVEFGEGTEDLAGTWLYREDSIWVYRVHIHERKNPNEEPANYERKFARVEFKLEGEVRDFVLEALAKSEASLTGVTESLETEAKPAASPTYLKVRLESAECEFLGVTEVLPVEGLFPGVIHWDYRAFVYTGDTYKGCGLYREAVSVSVTSLHRPTPATDQGESND